MRVIAGSAKGIELRAPQGWRGRPTTDRVRGAIFSMLEARETVRDRRVLDLFAGTGALSIEALSRGAASAVCVERGARESAAIRDNAARAGVMDHLSVYTLPVERAISTLDGSFDLVFMDPPYDDSDAIPQTVDALLARDGLLDVDAVIVIEQSRRSPADTSALRLDELATRRHGDTLISLFAVDASRDAGAQAGETSS